MIKFRSPRTYERHWKMVTLARKHALTPWQRYGSLTFYFLGLIVILLILIFGLIPQIEKLSIFWGFEVLVIFAFIIGSIFLNVYILKKVSLAKARKWPMAKIYAERNNFDMEVDETGIRYIGKNLEQRYGWSIIDKLIEQKDGSIVLVMDLHIHHFTLEDFESKELRDEFIKFAQEHMCADAAIDIRQ